MSVAIVTGSAGLIGAETVRFFADRGLEVVGIDCDLRRYFFGAEASTEWSRKQLEREVSRYTHRQADIRDAAEMIDIFRYYGNAVEVVVHTAAQPSHDWAAREPLTDFAVNASGTLNMLEACRKESPDAVFIHLSTNKVYGDTPNRLPLTELETRWEVAATHAYAEHGIDEQMSIDHTLHSLFGASKAAADLVVQEYGRYFGLKTACFRAGCLTGPGHAGAELHGFLAYLMKCAVEGQQYTVFGYQGKQVRDNIHSYDLVNALWHFYRAPRVAAVYNMGGGRASNCSVLEAITACERITGQPMSWSYANSNRVGDHIWWISDVRKFQRHYPDWSLTYDVEGILSEIHQACLARAPRSL